MENRGYSIYEAESPGGNDWEMKIYFHFVRKHTKDNTDFYSLNGTGVAIDKQAVYYVLENVNNGIILTENMVDYDYEKLHYELDNTDYPNKETFEKYIKKL